MESRSLETRREALDAIGKALTGGRVSFAEAISLRDLARAGRVEEVDKLLSALEQKRHT